MDLWPESVILRFMIDAVCLLMLMLKYILSVFKLQRRKRRMCECGKKETYNANQTIKTGMCIIKAKGAENTTK